MASAEIDVESIRSLVRAVLDQDDFPGRDQLRHQVGGIEYVGGPVTMVDIHVPRTFAASPDAPSPAPNRTAIVGHDGEVVGLLLLWVADGYLSCLEYAWVTDEMPTVLPTVDQFGGRWPAAVQDIN